VKATVIKRVETGTIFSYPFSAKAHPRHFYHPHVATPSDQLVCDSYGAANQNAWQLRSSQSERLAAMEQPIRFNDLITPSTNQSAPFPRLGHAPGASGRVEGVCFDAP